jgi:hypothetical protein
VIIKKQVQRGVRLLVIDKDNEFIYTADAGKFLKSYVNEIAELNDFQIISGGKEC